jgi:hypothetical protein
MFYLMKYVKEYENTISEAQFLNAQQTFAVGKYGIHP